MSVKLLEKVFIGTREVKGFHFKQLDMSKTAYIYQVGIVNPHFEVIVRKKSGICIDFKKKIYTTDKLKKVKRLLKKAVRYKNEEKTLFLTELCKVIEEETEFVENYPSSKAFGQFGWFCMTLCSARKKFNELSN